MKDWRGRTMYWTVYFLIDPRDGEIHYVGCSSNLRERFHCHMSSGRFVMRNPDWPGKPSRKQLWIKELLSLGLKPLLVPLIKTKDMGIHWALEEAWIRRMGLAGCDLFINGNRERLLADGIITPHQNREAGKIQPWYLGTKGYTPIAKIWNKKRRARA